MSSNKMRQILWNFHYMLGRQRIELIQNTKLKYKYYKSNIKDYAVYHHLECKMLLMNIL